MDEGGRKREGKRMKEGGLKGKNSRGEQKERSFGAHVCVGSCL